ncbi:MAG: ATP-binding protein [Sphaerochaetaceae bacterium]
MHLSYQVHSGDFSNAGSVSSTIKTILKQLNVSTNDIKRIVVALYEAEVNVVAHSYGGQILCDIEPEQAVIQVIDTGPGIPDLDLAMTEGWSTASAKIREMGFGAGMGLPNIKKNTDRLSIKTAAGEHTHIQMVFTLKEGHNA